MIVLLAACVGYQVELVDTGVGVVDRPVLDVGPGEHTLDPWVEGRDQYFSFKIHNRGGSPLEFDEFAVRGTGLDMCFVAVDGGAFDTGDRSGWDTGGGLDRPNACPPLGLPTLAPGATQTVGVRVRQGGDSDTLGVIRVDAPAGPWDAGFDHDPAVARDFIQEVVVRGVGEPPAGLHVAGFSVDDDVCMAGRELAVSVLGEGVESVTYSVGLADGSAASPGLACPDPGDVAAEAWVYALVTGTTGETVWTSTGPVWLLPVGVDPDQPVECCGPAGHPLGCARTAAGGALGGLGVVALAWRRGRARRGDPGRGSASSIGVQPRRGVGRDEVSPGSCRAG